MKTGIVVGRHGPLAAEWQRFLDALAWQEGQTSAPFQVYPCGDLNAPFDVNFSVARSKNEGIRKAIADGCDIIVAVDIDTPIPPGLLDFTRDTLEQSPKTHLWVTRKDMSLEEYEKHDYAAWSAMRPHGWREKTFPHGYCWGSYNAMTKAAWSKIGGFDERCFGWGGEDDLLHFRAKEAGLTLLADSAWPLAHINHPYRPYRVENNRGAENVKKFREGKQPNYLLVPRKFEPGVSARGISKNTPERAELCGRMLDSFFHQLPEMKEILLLRHDPGPIAKFADGRVYGPWPGVRALAMQAIKTEFVIWLEDDWVFDPDTKLDIQHFTEAIKASGPTTLGITFRAWPGPSAGIPGYPEFRRVAFSGLNRRSYPVTKYANASMSHWPPFTFNPGVYRSELFCRLVEDANGDELEAGKLSLASGLTLLCPSRNMIHHIGATSSINGKTWPLSHRAKELLKEPTT